MFWLTAVQYWRFTLERKIQVICYVVFDLTHKHIYKKTEFVFALEKILFDNCHHTHEYTLSLECYVVGWKFKSQY